ncbi:hypothetical protein GJV06_17870 [Enterobacteriaceae bacterium RIT691]|nr:hypothetical protein [Enterobacteriaceae bacterium RIT691]
MALAITGINTGVIRHGNQFQALALILKHPHNQTSLFLMPALVLRDLYICCEHRLHLQRLGNAKTKAAFQQKQQAATQALHNNIPVLNREMLLQATPRQHVETLTPRDTRADSVTLALRLQDGQTCDVIVEDAQIALLINAVTHALNNAGMHALSLRLSSLLDFLPLYDAEIKASGELEYDNYQHPAWKLTLFTHSLALVYHYTDSSGQQRACGTVIKTRVRGEMKAAQAIAKRLLAFSPRLKALEKTACRITVTTLASGAGHLPREHCLKALHQLWQKTRPVHAE